MFLECPVTANIGFVSEQCVKEGDASKGSAPNKVNLLKNYSFVLGLCTTERQRAMKCKLFSPNFVDPIM